VTVEHEQLSGPLAEYLAEEVPRVARNRHRRFSRIPVEDFEQQLWAKVYAEMPKFRKLLNEGKHGTIWLELLNAGTALGYEDERYQRAVKAANAGYSPDDEQFYSTDMLRALLPVLIEAEFEPANAIERATQGTDAAGVRIHGGDPDSATETYMVILIDVTQAFRKLSPYQRKLLEDYYGLSQEDDDNGRWERESFASSQGMTLKAYQNKVYRAMDVLQHKLGGRNPWLRPDSRKGNRNAA
jgi:hypothetical protein